jgi:hypothetical protein
MFRTCIAEFRISDSKAVQLAKLRKHFVNVVCFVHLLGMCLLCKVGITGRIEHWSGIYTSYFVNIHHLSGDDKC